MKDESSSKLSVSLVSVQFSRSVVSNSLRPHDCSIHCSVDQPLPLCPVTAASLPYQYSFPLDLMKATFCLRTCFQEIQSNIPSLTPETPKYTSSFLIHKSNMAFNSGVILFKLCIDITCCIVQYSAECPGNLPKGRQPLGGIFIT